MPLLRLAALLGVPALLAVPAARPETVPSRAVAAAPVPRAAETCVYLEASGKSTNYYFSSLRRLPYTESDLTYGEAGKAALQRVRQTWMNRVLAQHDEELHPNGVYTMWADVRSCEEQEAKRLRAVRDKRQNPDLHVFVVD